MESVSRSGGRRFGWLVQAHYYTASNVVMHFATYDSSRGRGSVKYVSGRDVFPRFSVFSYAGMGVGMDPPSKVSYRIVW
jgi:hypothetical protein